MIWLLPQNNKCVRDFDSVKVFNQSSPMAFIVSSEDTRLCVYAILSTYPSASVQLVPVQTLTPDFCENGLGIVRTNLTRLNGEVCLQIIAADSCGNIHLWTDLEQTNVVLTAHTKVITDMVVISLCHSSPPLVASCSLDGSLKVWDLQCSVFAPIFEHFSSKKWVYSLYFDVSLCALFLNQEGKNCPQKILYFKTTSSGTDLDEASTELAVSKLSEVEHPEKVIVRQYKLFNETLLQSTSFISNDFVYASGINGLVYRMAKRDMARLVHRHKEKLKGNLAKKLLQVRRTVARSTHSSPFKFEGAGDSQHIE